MTFSEFFWLDDAKFAAALMNVSDQELIFGDKHNVRKRKGGKLGGWVGAAQAPLTMGISLAGSGIAIRNRAVAKRRLAMIHAELDRRGLAHHKEDWKDSAFAAVAVGAGTAIGMGFVPGAEVAAQGFAEVGATTTAEYVAGVATSETLQHVGSLATETATMHYTDPDTYMRKNVTQKIVEWPEKPQTYDMVTEVSMTPPQPYHQQYFPQPSPPGAYYQQYPAYQQYYPEAPRY